MCLPCSYSMKHSSQHLHNLVALFTLMSLCSRGLECSLCACASYHFGGDVFILFSSGLAPSWEQVLSWLRASVHLARNPEGAREKPHHCMGEKKVNRRNKSIAMEWNRFAACVAATVNKLWVTGLDNTGNNTTNIFPALLYDDTSGPHVGNSLWIVNYNNQYFHLQNKTYSLYEHLLVLWQDLCEGYHASPKYSIDLISEM